MPLSNRFFDETVEKFLLQNLAENYFDIGVGAGKYGKMIKKVNPRAYVLGVEVNPDYIKKYDTEKVYDQIRNQSIVEFIRQNPSFSTDIAVMGDLLEHLFKSDGIDLIHYLLYRTKYMLILFPRKFIQIDIHGYPEEAHVSAWSESDFKEFNYTYEEKGHMSMVVIKGYLTDEETIINRLK